MEHKHTPGPWHLEGHIVYGPAHAESRHPNGRICIARVLRAGTERADPLLEGGADRFGFDSESDARLIAAAPELLEALLAIVSECCGPERPYSGDSYLPEQFIIAGRAAIAKAKGEQACATWPTTSAPSAPYSPQRLHDRNLSSSRVQARPVRLAGKNFRWPAGAENDWLKPVTANP